jgi:hypothetical protein
MYQDGKFHNRGAEWNALGILLFGTILWIIFFLEIYCYYILGELYSNGVFQVGFLIICFVGIILYRYLVYNKRYEMIYNRFKDFNIKQRRTGLSISLVYTFLPFFLVMYVALKMHNKI